MSIADLRTDYRQASLLESNVDANPIRQFSIWLDAAIHAQLPEPTAMNLATVGENHRPSSRIVLLKEVDAHGFVWFTNYESRKGRDLAHHPYAALLFFWRELERQVRIEGRVQRISHAESEQYFQSRPLASRLGALASAQSRPITDRTALEAQYRQAEQQYGAAPTCPAYWGGYRLAPDYVEFWQGRPSRLHDRIAYSLQAEGQWKRERLQP